MAYLQSDCPSVLERTMGGLVGLRLFRSVQSHCKAAGDQRTAHLFDRPMLYIALFVLSVREAGLRRREHGLSHADGAISRRRRTLSLRSNHNHLRVSRLSAIISFPHSLVFPRPRRIRESFNLSPTEPNRSRAMSRAEASCLERSVPSIDNPPPGTARLKLLDLVESSAVRPVSRPTYGSENRACGSPKTRARSHAIRKQRQRTTAIAKTRRSAIPGKQQKTPLQSQRRFQNAADIVRWRVVPVGMFVCDDGRM